MQPIQTQGKYIRLDDHTFHTYVLEKKLTCMVCIHSHHTGESSILEAIIERLMPEYPQVAFFRLNMDESPRTAQRFSIDRRQYALLFFRHGQVTDWHFGIIPKRVLRAKLDNLSQA